MTIVIKFLNETDIIQLLIVGILIPSRDQVLRKSFKADKHSKLSEEN